MIQLLWRLSPGQSTVEITLTMYAHSREPEGSPLPAAFSTALIHQTGDEKAEAASGQNSPKAVHTPQCVSAGHRVPFFLPVLYILNLFPINPGVSYKYQVPHSGIFSICRSIHNPSSLNQVSGKHSSGA
jgi:hypothetical protein